VETLRTMLGYTTLEMTLHYARQAGIDLTTAHEAFDPARSLKVRVSPLILRAPYKSLQRV
jgi:hypothetical protein